MHVVFRLAAWLLVLAPIGAVAGAHLGTPTPLTSVGATSDPDKPAPNDPGAGGGFSTQGYFQNRTTNPAAISACSAKIETVATAWAKKYALVQAERDAGPAALKLQYVKTGLKGLFELTYQVKQQAYARVTMNFYTQNGQELEPAAIRTFLTGYGIDSLEDALTAALTCGNRA
jgi:hypothetical protein